MKIKSLGGLAVASFALTLLWLGLLVVSLARSGLPGTFEQVLASLAQPDLLYYLTYASATLLTLVVTAFFAGLFAYCEPAASGWSLIGFVFVPVYCLLNLVVYLGQITVVPQLVALQQVNGYQAISWLLLRLTIQQWPGSAAGIFNNLAYAVLGIPSLIYGGVLARGRGMVRLGGMLLALNGAACIVGMAGVVLQNSFLSLGSLAGGALFLLALLPLSATFLREGASWRAQV